MTSSASTRPVFSTTRRAGLLLPLFSLRSGAERDDADGWGLGEIPDLPRLARWAGRSGFSVLQLLPFHQVGAGESSPYSAISAFALDPVYLGLRDCEDFVVAGGVERLPGSARSTLDHARASARVDWAAARALKQPALELAFEHFFTHEWRTDSSRARALRVYAESEAGWLDDFALHAALRVQHGPNPRAWPEALAARHPSALVEARHQHARALLFTQYVQWQLDTQWHAARAEARGAGVELAGDLPFTVSSDAACVWSRPDVFRTDVRLGVPPDAFSADGQDWGLPVFDWDVLARHDFDWLRQRAARAARLCSLWRVDHVVGLYRSYYRRNDGGPPGFVPADEGAQRTNGEAALRALFGAGEILAEDLGAIPDFVRESLGALAAPGLRVLRWEKDHPVFRDPAAYPALSVCTTGTHDNEPSAVWFDALEAEEKRALARIPGLHTLAEQSHFDDRVRDALLEVVFQSASALTILPFQDLFGTRERVNLPGTVSDDNWTYRTAVTVADLERDAAAIHRLRALAANGGRLGEAGGAGR